MDQLEPQAFNEVVDHLVRDGKIAELLAKHTADLLGRAEREELHRLLEEKYSTKAGGVTYGTVLSEYLCRNCGQPMRLTYDLGPFCPPLKGGCGKPFSYHPPSRTTIEAEELPMETDDDPNIFRI